MLPTPEQQRAFICTYLEAATEVTVIGTVVSEADVDAFSNQVQIFLLGNHFYLGLWGVCDEFDYLLYAVNHIRQYWITKQEQQEQEQYAREEALPNWRSS